MASASAIANTLVFSGFAAAATISQTLTHTEKDSATLESVIRDAESEAVLSTYGVDKIGRPLNNQNTLSELFASWDEEAGRASSPEPSSDETLAGTDAGQDGNAGRSEEVSRVWSLSELAADARKGIAISDFSHSLPDVDLTVTDLSIIRPCDSFAILGYYDLQKDPIIAETYTIPANDTRTNFPMTINWGNVFSNAVARGAFPLDARLSSAFLMAVWDIDSDSDGLTDLDELLVHHTDPNNPDSDGDGLNDGWEVANDMKPLRPDSDGDGLDDLLELEIGTNPSRSDSDNDGLPDGAEIDKGSDPNDPDTDGDGESDGSENDLGRDPTEDEDVGLVDPPPGTSAGTITGTAGVSFSWTADVGEDVEVPSLEVSTGNGEVSWGSGETYLFHMTVGGLSFVPSVTGLYEISLSADDDCEAFVGSVRVEDHYYGPHCEPKRGFFKAGQSYGVSVTLDNRGGPAGFGLSAELVKVYRERFESTFGSGVVLFESEYENKPGQRVPKNSTTIESHLVVTAGLSGGVLTLGGNYNEHLEIVCGSDKSPGSYYLNPFETVSCHAVYRGSQPSSALNDVTRIVSWKPNGSREEFATTNTLTVVEVMVEASADFPENKHRHVFGSYEAVNVRTNPGFRDAFISCVGCTGYECLSSRVPRRSGIHNISISHALFSYASQLSVIEPQSLKATSCEYATTGDWIERFNTDPVNPWVAGIVSLQMLPLYVSFENLSVVEGYSRPCGQTGVFRYAQILDHNGYPEQIDEASIGFANEVGDGDMFGISGFGVLEGFEPGGYYYSIPQYWCLKNDAQTGPVDSLGSVRQSYQLSEDNILTVSKHGYSVELEISPFPREGADNEN